MKKWIWITGMALLGAALPVAAEHSMAGMEAKKGDAQVTHHGVGKVVSVDRAGQKIKLAHEAIKSLGWPAMTMDFKVTKAALLNGLKVGDVVAFDLDEEARTGQWQIIKITLQDK